MAIIRVPYTVPVWVVVDTDQKLVITVEEDAGSVMLDDSMNMLNEEYDEIAWDIAAAAVAEDSTWPAWNRA